jgi:hypothetical protein
MRLIKKHRENDSLSKELSILMKMISNKQGTLENCDLIIQVFSLEIILTIFEPSALQYSSSIT